MADGRGTLIVETAQKQGMRLWWTPEDVVALSPFPPLPFESLHFIVRGRTARPFVTWCLQRYLSLTAGSAFLSRPSGLNFPRGLVSPQFFTQIYPNARVVATVLTPELEVKDTK